MSKDYNTQILFQDEFSLIDIYEVIFHMEKGKGLEQLNNFKKKKRAREVIHYLISRFTIVLNYSIHCHRHKDRQINQLNRIKGFKKV